MIKRCAGFAMLLAVFTAVLTGTTTASATTPPSAQRCLNNETPSHTETVTLSPGNGYRAVLSSPDNLWAGDTWKLVASGWVNDGRDGTWTPRGSAEQAPGNWPAPWAPKYSLVQRTGGSSYFFGYAGATTSCLTWNGPPAKTNIEIMMNDPYLGDNTGTWTVTLKQWYVS